MLLILPTMCLRKFPEEFTRGEQITAMSSNPNSIGILKTKGFDMSISNHAGLILTAKSNGHIVRTIKNFLQLITYTDDVDLNR